MPKRKRGRRFFDFSDFFDFDFDEDRKSEKKKEETDKNEKKSSLIRIVE